MTTGHQAIRLSGHQAIGPSGHQAIRDGDPLRSSRTRTYQPILPLVDSAPASVGIGANPADARRLKWEAKMDGTRPLLPPMPWQEFGQMKDEELKAIFAYLKTIKPVNNVVPPAAPPVMGRH